jgi:hypothetical protein
VLLLLLLLLLPDLCNHNTPRPAPSRTIGSGCCQAEPNIVLLLAMVML